MNKFYVNLLKHIHNENTIATTVRAAPFFSPTDKQANAQSR